MPFWSQMVSPREPKIAQNPQTSSSRCLPESTLQKVTKNDAIWVPSRPQNIRFRRVGVSKIKKSPVTKNVFKMTSKCLPFWSLWAPKITKNTEKRTLKKTWKIGCKKYQKRSQKDLALSRGNVINITKIRALGSKCAPKPPGGVPRHPKYSKIIKKWAPGPPKSFKIIWEPGNPKSRKSWKKNFQNSRK